MARGLGDNLPKVLDLKIGKKSKAQDFTKASLARLIGLDDRLAITRIAGLGKDVRDALLELPDNELKALGRRLDTAELDGLSRYLTGLKKTAGEQGAAGGGPRSFEDAGAGAGAGARGHPQEHGPGSRRRHHGEGTMAGPTSSPSSTISGCSTTAR